jgi:hypothetical protein
MQCIMAAMRTPSPWPCMTTQESPHASLPPRPPRAPRRCVASPRGPGRAPARHAVSAGSGRRPRLPRGAGHCLPHRPRPDAGPDLGGRGGRSLRPRPRHGRLAGLSWRGYDGTGLRCGPRGGPGDRGRVGRRLSHPGGQGSRADLRGRPRRGAEQGRQALARLWSQRTLARGQKATHPVGLRRQCARCDLRWGAPLGGHGHGTLRPGRHAHALSRRRRNPQLRCARRGAGRARAHLGRWPRRHHDL